MRLRTNKETETTVWKPKRRKKKILENQQKETPTQQPQPVQQPYQPVDQPETKKEISLKEALEKLYTDTKSAPSYSAKINAFLRENNVHSVHRRIVKKTFPRRKIIARFPFDIFMADLIEYPNLKFQNNRYVYILIVIDCFSKKVWAVAMKEKSATWTADAFEMIFKNFDEFPTHLITDGGLGESIYPNLSNKIFRIFQRKDAKCFPELWNQSLQDFNKNEVESFHGGTCESNNKNKNSKIFLQS